MKYLFYFFPNIFIFYILVAFIQVCTFIHITNNVTPIPIVLFNTNVYDKKVLFTFDNFYLLKKPNLHID